MTWPGIAAPAAEARVRTASPGRFLAQLCKHAGQVHRLRHRPGGHGRGEDGAGQPPAAPTAEWDGNSGTISFGWGTCTLRATPGTLTLRAEAGDEKGLRRIQELLTRNLERMGRREQLRVEWDRP